ncbi:MAG: phosphatase PAP2 family protein [Candidatus Micrarchaeota archaeon]|nr:phosphatase PAP2 family protein [Candidatus Micrarchaeota archaeon]
MDIISALNSAAFQFASSVASPALNFFMQYFADSFYIVLAALIVYLYLKKDKNLFAFTFAMVALVVIGEIIKLIVQEPRPCQIEQFSWTNNFCESGFGFPSNHATTLTGLFFFIKNYNYLRVLYIIWLALILFGRVYLGVHYLTDVIAGIVISLIVAAAIYRFRTGLNKFFGRIANMLLPPLFNREWSE